MAVLSDIAVRKYAWPFLWFST